MRPLSVGDLLNLLALLQYYSYRPTGASSAYYFSSWPVSSRSRLNPSVAKTYDPHPPDPRNTVIYSFSPLKDGQKHRNVRDLNWRDDDDDVQDRRDRALLAKFSDLTDDEGNLRVKNSDKCGGWHEGGNNAPSKQTASRPKCTRFFTHPH